MCEIISFGNEKREKDTASMLLGLNGVQPYENMEEPSLEETMPFFHFKDYESRDLNPVENLIMPHNYCIIRKFFYCP